MLRGVCNKHRSVKITTVPYYNGSSVEFGVKYVSLVDQTLPETASRESEERPGANKALDFKSKSLTNSFETNV